MNAEKTHTAIIYLQQSSRLFNIKTLGYEKIYFIAAIMCFTWTAQANNNIITSPTKKFCTRIQGDWVETIAKSSDGKMLRVKYKINSMTRKLDRMAGAYYFDGYKWMSAIIYTDNIGYYVSYFGTRYYL